MWRRLYLPFGEDDGTLEALSGYSPGGYHPVHLHDYIHDGQYRVIHKLGHGGFSTVWLCQYVDHEELKYAAVKILVARQAERECRELQIIRKLREKAITEDPGGEYICLPLDQFEIQGPNGTHICLVYPVLGPRADSIINILDEDETLEKDLHDISRQATEALAVLHAHGICHGDFRPSNLLLQLESLDGLEEERVLELLGEPETAKISIRKDSLPTPIVTCAPKYLVYSVDAEKIDTSLLQKHLHVIDFGESLDIHEEPRPTSYDIPVDYCAPEVFLDKLGGLSMDLWALGCTIFEIRTGQHFFEIFQLLGCSDNEYFISLALLLGKLQDRWWSRFSKRDELFKTDEDPSCHTLTTVPGRISGRSPDPCSIRDTLVTCHRCAGNKCAHPLYELVPEDEIEVMADLLEKLVRCNPEERLAAQDVLGHSWFEMPSRESEP